MSSHPDADAFVRAILNDPAEVTTRLAFADWLEETGDPANVAWAQFIRLNDEEGRLPLEGERRRELEKQLADVTRAVRATLTIDARHLIGKVEHFWRLLPMPNLTLRVSEYELSQALCEFIPESVARENVIIPVDLRGNHLTIAVADPGNYDTLQKLTFILNKEVIPVRATAEEIRAALDHYFGRTEKECVDSVFYEFPDVALFFSVGPPYERP